MIDGRAIALLLVAPMALAGPLLLVLAVVSVVRTEVFIHSAIEVDGKIVNFDRIQGNNGRSYYAPIVRFTQPDGQLYTLTSRTTPNPRQFKAGERIKVVYQPGHPEGARIKAFGLFLFPMDAGILGAALTLLTVILVRRMRRARAHPA